MQVDKTYWEKLLEHPYSPNDGDVFTYASNIEVGSTLLLGCTHRLLSLSNKQMDIDPWYKAETVIVKDWCDNKDYFVNIIGDGVLNLNKQLSECVLTMASKCCKNFVVRCFNFKLEKMRVAEYFPCKNDFVITPSWCQENKEYNFYKWCFQ